MSDIRQQKRSCANIFFENVSKALTFSSKMSKSGYKKMSDKQVSQMLEGIKVDVREFYIFFILT